MRYNALSDVKSFNEILPYLEVEVKDGLMLLGPCGLLIS